MIYCFLTTSAGNDVPQCCLDDSEGADVAWLDIVIRAEQPPTLQKPVARHILALNSMHLPGFGTAH